jgi:hypothetical protein
VSFHCDYFDLNLKISKVITDKISRGKNAERLCQTWGKIDKFKLGGNYTARKGTAKRKSGRLKFSISVLKMMKLGDEVSVI